MNVAHRHAPPTPPTDSPAEIPNAPKRDGLGARLLKQFRLLFFSHKVFEGTHYETVMAIRKFVAESGAVLMHVTHEKGILKYDYHLRDTKARKVCSKKVFYYYPNAITDLLGFRPGLVHRLYA